jgi:hypothetical protein
MSDAAFRDEVQQTIELYESIIGHVAARTRQMIEQHGEIEALSQLVVSADLQQGFKVLRDSNQLPKSFEALVVRFRHLFETNAVEAAEWRMDNPYALL